eukprot:GHVT01011920.1.p1 GENE.GHVT01011920.1~~GHVT01011920.1.p1  ORF type:complete len:710 (+),score=154.53 GHVT01011920.1:112-2241(+)
MTRPRDFLLSGPDVNSLTAGKNPETNSEASAPPPAATEHLTSSNSSTLMAPTPIGSSYTACTSSLTSSGAASASVAPHVYAGRLGDRCASPSSLSADASPNVKSRRKEQLAILGCGLGFFADAYDFFVIDLVLDILIALEGPTSLQISIVAAATLAGAFLGQIAFGLFADLLGRRFCFLLTAALVVVGALLSASSCHIPAGTSLPWPPLLAQIAIARFLLGLGVGGEYPLAAAVSSESAEVHVQIKTVAAVFSTQGLGLLLSPVLVYALLRGGLSLESTWRLAFAFGALPSMLAFALRLQMHDTKLFRKAHRIDKQWRARSDDARPSEVVRPLLHKPDRSLAPDAPTRYSKLPAVSSTFGRLGTATNSPPSSLGAVVVTTPSLRPASSSPPSSSPPSPSPSSPSPSSPSSPPPRRCSPSSLPGVWPARLGASWFPWWVLAGLQACRAKLDVGVGAHFRHAWTVMRFFRRALLGTMACWFLIDVTLYGNGSFKSLVARRLLDAPHAATGHRTLRPAGTDQPNCRSGHGDASGAAARYWDRNYWPQPFGQHRDDARGSTANASSSSSRGVRDGSIRALMLQVAETTSAVNVKDDDAVRARVLRSSAFGILVGLVALPGYFMTVAFIQRIRPRNLQLFGFLAVGSLFLALGIEQTLQLQWHMFEVIVFSLTFFFSNFGPNATTFILPAVSFPTLTRAACHGKQTKTATLGTL